MPGDNEYKIQNRLQGQRKAEEYTKLARKMGVKRGAQKYFLDNLELLLRQYNQQAAAMSQMQVLDQKNLDNLRKKALLVTDYCERFFSTKTGKEKTPFNAAIRNVSRVMQKDFKTIENARIDGTTTFADMIRSSKERTIRLGNQQGQIVGDALSKRMLLNVQDGQQRTVRGLFTQNSKLDFITHLTNDIARWKREYPGLAPMFKDIERERKAFNKKYDADYSAASFIARCCTGTIDEETGEKLAVFDSERELGKLSGDYDGLPGYREWSRDLGKNIDVYHLHQRYYIEAHQLSQGVNIDGRNSAMSTVADLLHCGDLLAKSTPMAVKGPDGKTVHGTFTEFVDGTDVHHLSPDDPYLQSNSADFVQPTGLKSIANLNVLDFICGNTDRHRANVLYKFDENNKVIGVKGIDNDMSFGTLNNYQLTNGENRMSSVDELQVVGKDMAEAIKALTPEMLKASLRGYGLEEDELDAAAQRLNMVKERINTKEIATVADNEWGNYSLTGLANKCGAQGLFFTVNELAMDKNEIREIMEAQLQGKAKQDDLSFGQAAFEKKTEDYAKLSEQMGKYFQKLKDVNSGFFISSREFNNMKNYTEFMRDEFGRMANQTPPEGMDPETFRKNQFEKTKLMMDSLRDLTGMYLNHRNSDGKLKTNTTAQKRTLVATELNAMALNNCNRFNLPDDEMYREGLSERRRNAYKNMSPKEIGNRIKNLKKIVKQHPNDPNLLKEAQKSFNRYFGQVMGKNPAEYGLEPNDLPPQAGNDQPQAGNNHQNSDNQQNHKDNKKVKTIST